MLGTQTVTAGQSVSFSVDATGSGSLTYQWYENGVAIPGATNSSYTIPDATIGNAGNYTIAVTDAYGDTTSITYTLTVNTPIPVMPPLAMAALALLLMLSAVRWLPRKSQP